MKYRKAGTFLLVILVILGGYRYYHLNKNIKKMYTIDKHYVGESVALDNCDISVISLKEKESPIKKQNQSDEVVQLFLKINIKNTSDDTIDCSRVIDSSIASIFHVSNAVGGEYDKNKLKSLGSGENVPVILEYTIPKNKFKNKVNKEEWGFYISRTLYKNEIISRAKGEKFENYAKCVILN